MKDSGLHFFLNFLFPKHNFSFSTVQSAYLLAFPFFPDVYLTSAEHCIVVKKRIRTRQGFQSFREVLVKEGAGAEFS